MNKERIQPALSLGIFQPPPLLLHLLHGLLVLLAHLLLNLLRLLPRVADVTAKEETRIDMHDAELNRVLGGGLVKGSLVLVEGEPGIGAEIGRASCRERV